MLALGVGNGRVMLVDAATGVVRWEARVHPRAIVFGVAMSPDGGFVASVDDIEEYFKIWESEKGEEWMTGDRHDGTGACTCTMTKTGRRKTLDEGCPVLAHTQGLSAVAFSPCGRLATGGEDTAVIIWDARTGKGEHRMWGHTRIVTCVSFSADGAQLASSSEDRSICVWEVSSGALLRRIPKAHEVLAGSVHFSPTEIRRLASGSGKVSPSAKQWDVDSGEMLCLMQGCTFVVFSPDGHTIATANARYEEDVQLINAQSGQRLRTMIGHEAYVPSANFSRDGSKLASGSFDGTCKVWDSSTGELLRTIDVGARILSVYWGRDWVRDTQRGAAFAMGHHPRLGAGSRVQGLDAGVIRMILDLT